MGTLLTHVRELASPKLQFYDTVLEKEGYAQWNLILTGNVVVNLVGKFSHWGKHAFKSHIT